MFTKADLVWKLLHRSTIHNKPLAIEKKFKKELTLGRMEKDSYYYNTVAMVKRKVATSRSSGSPSTFVRARQHEQSLCAREVYAGGRT